MTDSGSLWTFLRRVRSLDPIWFPRRFVRGDLANHRNLERAWFWRGRQLTVWRPR